MCRATLIIWLGAILLPTRISSAFGDGLEAVVARADSILVGDLLSSTVREGRHHAEIIVVRVLKGTWHQRGALIRVCYSPGARKGGLEPAFVRERGLLFLSRDPDGAWVMNSLGPPRVGVGGGYIALGRGERDLPEMANVPALERVIEELAVAANQDETGRIARVLLSTTRPHSAENIYRRWAYASSGHLGFYGLAGLIALEDSSVLPRLRAEIGRATPQEAALLGAALSGFRRADPEAVRHLGELAIDSGTRLEVRNGAISALCAIHSRDTLPFIYELLASSDPLTRAFAVRAFSAFVSGMRITRGGTDEAEALDEVLNPGRRRSLPSKDVPFETEETRRFLHFGPFKDAAEEGAYVTYRREWFERHRHVLSQP